MKKAGKTVDVKLINKVKSRFKKRYAVAGGAVLLAAVVVVTSVINRSHAAENADTLMGIEKLRNRMAEGGEFTILEIVPKPEASEIGYLFDGYEPLLSEYNSDTMSWKSWKDVLCSYDTVEERAKYINEKKAQLQDYYNKYGIVDNVPVTIPTEDYAESSTGGDGFEKVEGGGYDAQGYFSSVKNNTGDYFVSFKYINSEKIANMEDAIFYKVSSMMPILKADADYIADGAYVYRQNETLYECIGTWGSVKEKAAFPSEGGEGSESEGDENKGENGGNTGNETEGGDGGATGSEENSETGGDGGTETGNGDTTGSGDGSETGGNGGAETGNGGTTGSGDGSETGGNSGAETGDGDTTGSEENSETGGTSSSSAVRTVGNTNTWSQFNWVKLVSASVANINAESQDHSNDNAGNAGGSETSRDEEQNGKGSMDNAQGDPDGSNGGQTGTENGSGDNGTETGNGSGDNGTGNDSGNSNPGTESGDGSGDGGSGTESGSGDNGSGSGDNGNGSGDNGNGSGDNGTGTGSGSGDNGSGTGSGDNGTGTGSGSGDNGTGTGSGSGDNGSGTGNESGNNGSDDENEDNNTGEVQDPGEEDPGNDDEEENPGDGNLDEENPDDEEESQGGNKKPGKGFGDSEIKPIQASSDEIYWLVYFDRIMDPAQIGNEGAYVVDSIEPATLSNFGVASEYYIGQYNFTVDSGDNTQMYSFPGRKLYCKGIFHNNEWFKQYVVNMNKDNFDKFNVKVITATPDDLSKIYENGNEEYAKGTLPDFDFLYLNSGLRTAQIDIVNGNGNGNDPQSGGGSGSQGGGNSGGSQTGGNQNGEGEPSGNQNGNDSENDQSGEGEPNSGQPETGEGEPNSGQPESGEGEPNGGQPESGEGEPNGSQPETGEGEPNGGQSESGEGEPNGGQPETGEGEPNGGQSESGEGDPDNSQSGVSADNSNEPLATQYMSAWRNYVSEDNTEEAENNKSNNEADQGNTGDTVNSPDTQNEGDAADSKDTEDTETPGNTADTGDTENTGDDADTGNPGDTENTGDAADTGNTGDTENADGTADTGDNTDLNGNADGDAAEASDENESGGSTGKELISNGNISGDIVTLYSTGGADIEKTLADLIYTKVSANALPCLVDGSILYGKTEGGAIEDKIQETEGTENTENTQNTQMFRLAAMLCQPTLEDDYTGVSKADLLKNIEDGDKNFTTEQVYCRLGNGKDSIINSKFFTPTIYKAGGDIKEVEEGFRNVLDEINLENLYRESDTSNQYRPLPTDISQAEAIRHILNYQNRRNVDTKKEIKVLEIQPAYTTKAELDLDQIKKWAPGVEKVDTTIMTTSEFIGKIDKINEIYDLIYIGTSKEHLNLSNWITDTGKSKDGEYLGSTVYNDKDMDGLIYSNVGDKRVVYLPMSGLLESEYKNGRTFYYNFVRYSGNDITKEKEEALLSFLDGSYPVVVSDEFIEQPVTVFEDDNFKGRRATLGVGSYDEDALLKNQIFVGANTPQKGISSIQVKEGYSITLYENSDLTGEYITIQNDVASFTASSARLAAGQTWNNRCRSIVVEKLEDAMPEKEIDGNHIDNSSYLYEFVNTALEKKYNNFYAKSDIDENGDNLFKFYLNRAKASLVDFSANGFKGSELGNGEGQTGSQVNDVYYIYPNVVGRYNLQYDFTIQNEGAASMDTRYYCKLYIDVNADGKFSEFEEVSDIIMTNRSSGGNVSPNELYAGVPYTISREVPTGYKGLLPWKVEVCQVNNSNIYASKQGYTKLNGLDKEVLKICQITKDGPDADGDGVIDDVIDLNYEINTPGRYFNILVNGGDHDGVHYPGITDDFELDVTTISISEYENEFKNNSSYLDGFNMLILGFSDMYGDFTGDAHSGAMGAIVDFINSGKSVLLAHDTTSFFNNPIVDGSELGYTNRNGNELQGYRDDTRFAATLNKFVRPLVGMDRYGVLAASDTKEKAYKPKSGRKETVPEIHGYTYGTITAKDKRPDGSGDLDYNKDNLYLRTTPGYGQMENPVFRNEYVSQRFDDCWENGGGDIGKDNGEMNLVNNGEVWEVHATQVNKGQITEYPYKIEDDFEVGLTHSQYYQLDYTADDDGDNQSDLVVWYCLGGRTPKFGDEKTAQTIYSQSPNDVRNNYYIYNKGNITYTGMGHASKNGWNKNNWYTFEEAKLFINTMIASYQAGVKPPSITVLESGLPEAAKLTTMYRYYDEANAMSLSDAASVGDYERVYFTVRDLNFVKGSRVIEAHAYYHLEGAGGSQTINVDGEEIAVNPLEDLIHSASTGDMVGPYPLNSGDIYYIDVPKTILDNCENGLDIYFEAQSTITTNTTNQNIYTTDKVYTKLQVLRAYLFELD